MPLNARRQLRLLSAVGAAVTFTACTTWWLTSALETRHLDLIAVLIVGSLGALLIGRSGKRS